MRKLPLIGFLLLVCFSVDLIAGSPHGEKFNIACSFCHSAKGWKLDKEIYSFDHNSTAMPLTGRHQEVGCRQCHVSLVFSEAKKECIDCHTDMHYQTVGPDCGRCHTTQSWLVNNISEIHRRTRFPLFGPHYAASCTDCHKSSSFLRFEPLGVECYDCHSSQYNSTTSPNHVTSGYSKNCTECHSMNSFTWSSASINHSFFPLTQGHAISDCSRCHKNGVFTGLSPECVSCHLTDYTNSTNPNHASLGFSTTCTDCHTTMPGWKPAMYRQHDAQFFPIYSGSHNGTWSICADCHKNPADYMTYTCIDCHAHNQTDMNNGHADVGGYAYNSPACFACHPTGSTEGSFNHNNSPFPLTGAHITTPCSKCHASGFANTPTACSACHLPAYNQSTNPNHAQISIPTTCADCHTTNPGWKPAAFPIHANYWAFQGAHIAIAANCSQCHNGNYNNTPNTCVGCHQADYNNTTNPPHASAQFPTDCQSCHTQTAWSPSTFNHDGQYFPIYSGKHQGTWTLCADCHTNSSNFAVFSCITCHVHNQTDMNNAHSGVTGYSYNSAACYQCHPTGNSGGKMKNIKMFKQKENR
jgi:hypothetical protein